MPENRNEQGRFVKGKSGNPGGRPGLSPELKKYGRQAPNRLRALADDEYTPVKVKADIEKWFAEMYYGRARQAVDMDANVTTGNITVSFEGELDEWSK